VPSHPQESGAAAFDVAICTANVIEIAIGVIFYKDLFNI
jgi:hypothetical protein